MLLLLGARLRDALSGGAVLAERVRQHVLQTVADLSQRVGLVTELLLEVLFDRVVLAIQLFQGRPETLPEARLPHVVHAKPAQRPQRWQRRTHVSEGAKARGWSVNEEKDWRLGVGERVSPFLFVPLRERLVDDGAVFDLLEGEGNDERFEDGGRDQPAAKRVSATGLWCLV